MFSFWARAPWAAQHQQPPAAAAVPPAAAAAFDSSATTSTTIPAGAGAAAAEEGPAYPQQTHNHQARRKRDTWMMEEEAQQIRGCYGQRHKVARLKAPAAAAGWVAGAFSSFPALNNAAPAQASAAIIPAAAAATAAPAAAMEEAVRLSQQQEQGEEQEQTAPPTLAGQSRRHSPAYMGHPAQQNALALLMARSRAAASAAAAPAPAGVASQGSDCGVCPLLPTTSGRACKSPRKAPTQPQQQQLQQVMLPISYGASSHHIKTVAATAPSPAATADCWRAVGRCRHCDRGICKTCLRGCEGCGETYCSLCSTIDYGGPAERVLCLECSQRLSSQQQQESGSSSMMDLS